MSSANATELYLIRHGETEWSKSGQHTGTTDLPLTEAGEQQARNLAPLLAKVAFDLVLVSPRQRAQQTVQLAGIHGNAQTEPNLQEWNYGIYEGVTTADVRKTVPDWNIWRSAMPQGEVLAQVEARAQLVIDRCLQHGGRCALVAHAHIFRVLTGVFLQGSGLLGEHLTLSTASMSVLGVDRGVRVMKQWNLLPPSGVNVA